MRIYRLISLIGVFLLFLYIAPLSRLFADTTPDTTSSLSASPGELPADGNSTSTVTVTLRNNNNLITSGTVSLSVTNSATVDQSSIGLGSSGTAIFTIRSTTVGSDTVTVNYNGTAVNNVSTSITFDTPVTPTYTPTPTPLNYCGDPVPGSTPQLISAVSQASHQVTLTWSGASSPFTYYLLSYGLSSGNYIYGNPDIGGPGVTSYTVGNLSNGVTYYFAIRAVNGCKPGSLSNELTGVAGAATATPVPTDTVDTSTDSVPSDTPTTDMPADTSTPTPTSALMGSDNGSTSTGTGLSPKMIGYSVAAAGVVLGIIGGLFYIASKKKPRASAESLHSIPLDTPRIQDPEKMETPENRPYTG